ncbi:MAG: hypothetical protein EXR77_14250 [Myxococcales bacterium]|nr:hypothetical protein [Myxococcales bacterium]
MAATIIGRGREADVLRLLAPYRDGQPVADGVTVDAVRIGGGQITVELRDTTGKTALIALRPALPVRNDKAFAVDVPPTDGVLGQAANLVAAAVRRNDDGTFFASTSGAVQTTTQSLSAGPAAPDLWFGLAWATAGLWVVLAACIAAKAMRRPRSWSASVFGAVILVLAAAARRAAPFTPLHADDHAYVEMAVGLGLPQVDQHAARLMHDYGPAWWQLQRWTAGLWGNDHEALGRWAAAVGAIATVLAVLAARRACGQWLPALAGAALMCWAPLAVRVGNSESTLVVAQLLVAAALWLASPPYPAGSGRLDALGVLCALGLLATGHPLGPVFAVGAGLCSWALSIRPKALAPSAKSAEPARPARSDFGNHDGAIALHFSQLAPEQVQLLNKGNDTPSPTWLPASHNLVSIVAGVVAVGALVAWHWGGQATLIGNRLAATGGLPIPRGFWLYELWWTGQWAPTVLTTAVAAAGLAGFYAQRAVHGRAIGMWSAAALVFGTGAMLAAGLLVVACTTDALRYQAPMAAVWVLIIAFAPRCADLTRDRARPVVYLAVLAAMVIGTLQCFLTPNGATAADAQAQAYAILRRELAAEKGDLWLLAPDRPVGEKRHVVIDVPVGSWTREGPMSHRVSADEFAQACEMGIKPTNTWVYLAPACEAVDLPSVGTPCAAIARFLDPTGDLRAGFLRPWSGVMAQGLPGEFHTYPSDTVAWRLGKARCPP